MRTKLPPLLPPFSLRSNSSPPSLLPAFELLLLPSACRSPPPQPPPPPLPLATDTATATNSFSSGEYSLWFWLVTTNSFSHCPAYWINRLMKLFVWLINISYFHVTDSTLAIISNYELRTNNICLKLFVWLITTNIQSTTFRPCLFFTNHIWKASEVWFA